MADGQDEAREFVSELDKKCGFKIEFIGKNLKNPK